MDDLQDINEMTPSKLNNLLEKRNIPAFLSKGFLKSLLFLFIGTCFSLFSQGKTYFLNKVSTSYITEVNIPYAANSLALFILFVCSSIYIQFKFKRINLMTIIITLLFSILSIIEAQGYGSNSSEFSHVIATWILIIYIIGFFLIERSNFLNHSIYLYIGLAVGICGNTLELLFTFLDVRKEIDPLRAIFTDADVKNNLLAIVNSLFYCAIFYLIERHFKDTKQVLYFLPYFSGISCVIDLIASLIAKEFKNLKEIYHSSDSGPINLTIVGCSIAAAVIFGSYPLLIVRCSTFALIICFNFRLFWRYIFLIIEDNDKYENMLKYLGGHIFAMLLFLVALFIICYNKLKDEVDDEEGKLIDDVKKLPKEGGKNLGKLELNESSDEANSH